MPARSSVLTLILVAIPALLGAAHVVDQGRQIKRLESWVAAEISAKIQTEHHRSWRAK